MERLIKKALKSRCKYKVAAVAFDHKGDILGYSSNRPRFSREGGSTHAEAALMKQYRSKIKTIIIVRVNNRGELKPIDPCEVCASIAQALGIRIQSI